MKIFKNSVIIMITVIIGIYYLSCEPKRTFRDVTKITGSSYMPNIKAVGGTDGRIYLAWREVGVYFTTCEIGEAFIPIKTQVCQISSGQPELFATGPNVFVAGSKSDGSIGHNIYFASSNDYGQTFNSEIRLSNNTVPSTTVHIANRPSISGTGDYVYVVWTESYGPSSQDVLYRYSTDGGISFSQVDTLTDQPLGGGNAKVAARSNFVFIIWSDTQGNLKFMKSTDYGVTFSNPQNLNSNPCLQGFEEISVSGNNVYVLWHEGSDIILRASNDDGNSFIQARNISNSSNNSVYPQMLAVDNYVHVIWEERLNNTEHIFYARSANSGASFSGPENMSQSSSTVAWRPQISGNNQYVHIVWQGKTGNDFWDVLYRRSTNSGGSFESAQEIAQDITDTVEDVDPVIVSRMNDRYIAWSRGNSQASQLGIMFYSSIDCPVMAAESGFKCIF